MPSTGAGDLRQLVSFYAPDTTPDEYGNVTTGWQYKFTVSAQITPRLGGESVEAARLAGRQPAIIRVRCSPDTRLVRTDWKVTDMQTSVDYNVRSVADPLLGTVEHGRWIDVLAESGVAV
jgi:head-tail adaptor